MIRNARVEDSKAIAKLVLIILKDMEVAFLKDFGEEMTVEVITKTVASPTYRYGYTRGIVKEIDGEIAGIAFGYLAEEEAIIDLPLSETLKSLNLPDAKIFVDPETYPGEWYLDTIVVNEKFRGRGVGTELLAAVNSAAKQAGANKVGLCVDLVNPKAQQLYQRQGFQIVGEQILSGHDYYHMQCAI